MNPPPVNSPRHLPRFLPTLTEVVHPSDLAAMLSAPSPVPTPPSPVATQPVDPVVASRPPDPELQALVNAAVATQMQMLQTRVLEELEIMVQQAVNEAVNAKSAPP